MNCSKCLDVALAVRAEMVLCQEAIQWFANFREIETGEMLCLTSNADSGPSQKANHGHDARGSRRLREREEAPPSLCFFGL